MLSILSLLPLSFSSSLSKLNSKSAIIREKQSNVYLWPSAGYLCNFFLFILVFWLILATTNFRSMSYKTWKKNAQMLLFCYIKWQIKAAKQSLELACFQNWQHYILYPGWDLVIAAGLCLWITIALVLPYPAYCIAFLASWWWHSQSQFYIYLIVII